MLVTAFNTTILELQILGKRKFDTASIRNAINNKQFPEKFFNTKLRQSYYSCVFVDFTFRGLPRVAERGETTHYVHGGRANIVFKSYVLNDDDDDIQLSENSFLHDNVD